MDKTKFGCKFGLKCTKFESDYDIQKYYDMKKILEKLELSDIMTWSNAKAMYKSFMLEHTTLYKYKQWNSLPRDAKIHLKEYLVNRLSITDPNGELYKRANSYYTNILDHKKVVKSSGVTAKKTTKDKDKLKSSKYKAYKNTSKCQGLAKSNFAPYCKHVVVGAKESEYYCPLL